MILDIPESSIKCVNSILHLHTPRGTFVVYLNATTTLNTSHDLTIFDGIKMGEVNYNDVKAKLKPKRAPDKNSLTDHSL